MIRFFSGEFWLDRRANGGTVVVLRSAWIAALGYLATILLRELLDPASICEFSLRALRTAAFTNLAVFGAIFAAAYAALYARFASQWTYLAGLYNQIMAAKVRGVGTGTDEKSAMCAWEAGFLEDADELHLARKPMFAGVILSMLEDPDIRAKYIDSTAGGEPRLLALERAAKLSYQNAELQRQRRR